MKVFFLIIFFPVFLSAQKWYPKLTPEQDLTFDYYSNAFLSFGTAKIVDYYSHKPILGGFCGIGAGFVRSLFERGLYGKIVSASGAVGGSFIFIVYKDLKRKKTLKFNSRKYVLD